jgi:hypothetical protein
MKEFIQLKIKDNWEIRFKDIDPDTGVVTQDKLVAITGKEANAIYIVEALNRTSEEPNRDFYVKFSKEVNL